MHRSSYQQHRLCRNHLQGGLHSPPNAFCTLHRRVHQACMTGFQLMHQELHAPPAEACKRNTFATHTIEKKQNAHLLYAASLKYTTFAEALLSLLPARICRKQGARKRNPSAVHCLSSWEPGQQLQEASPWLKAHSQLLADIPSNSVGGTFSTPHK